MLGEIIQGLTAIHENTEITSENLLYWAKRVEAQRTLYTFMNNLTEAKDFYKIKIVKNTNHNTRKSIQTKMPTRHTRDTVIVAMPPDDA